MHLLVNVCNAMCGGSGYNDRLGKGPVDTAACVCAPKCTG